MSLKERLFGPAWESKDADVRARAVAESRDPNLADTLPGIARDDPDAGVRLAALRRIDSESAWLDARASDTDPAVVEAADRALLRRVCANAADDTQRRRDWLAAVESPDTLRHLARHASDAELRRDALARIASPGFLGDRLLDEPDNAIALELIGRIDQVSTLRRVARPLRAQRKQRYQAVMRRLAMLEDGATRHGARDALADHLVQQAEQLARGDSGGHRGAAHGIDRGAEIRRLEAEWQSLPDPGEARQRRFQGALKIVRRSLEAAAQPTESGATAPAPDGPGTRPEFDALIERARKLATRPASDDSAPQVSALISEFDRAWNALKSPGEADRAARTHFMALAGELQARQQALAPERRPASPGPLADTLGNDRLEALDQALETAGRALDAGDISAAHAAIGEARAAYERLPRKDQPSAVAGRLTRMAGKLKEMRDWQHWSNNKLRERLIERVAEIDASQMHPDAVTDRLKELRERWKELDRQEVLPGDKRRFAAPQRQWRRFQKACKEAFDAARPYLEKRTEVREESLRELEAFLDQAERLADDDDAQTRALIRHQRAAREAIRNLDALPPKSRGRMAGRLRALMDAISARLDRHFDAVADEKRRLVAEARKLGQEKDRAAAIDRAKALQAEWKKLGASRRKLDDKLWREFRAPIDPLFEDLKAERARQRDAEQQQTGELEALCRQAETLAGGEAGTLEDATGPMAGLEERFARHERVPPKLRKRFDKAVSGLRKRLEAERRARARAATAHLETLAGAVQRCWEARLNGEQTARPRDLPQIDADDGVGQRLLERLAEVLETETPQLQARIDEHDRQARQVVIEAECLAGVDTPQHDRQQRMDYQIRRLSDRLGEGAPRPDLDAERDALGRRWLESHPHDPRVHAELAKRFAAADRILEQMTAH